MKNKWLVGLLSLSCTLVSAFALASCSNESGKDGKSAYEIAVEHGFVGTEEEWLASLQGAVGVGIKSVEFDENGLIIITLTDGTVLDGIELPEQTVETLQYRKIAGKEEYRVIGLGTVSDLEIVIPETYKGLPVTEIGENAFDHCDNLTSVVIGDSVTTIGDQAFFYCSNLTSVEIPNSVKSIGDNAFSWCQNLTSVVIPDSVTTIGDYAFSFCYKLTSITVDENNVAYKTIDGNLYTKDGKILIQYAIGKTETSFTVPSGVETIGTGAFYDCDNLTSVVIGDSVTTIGDQAFYYCSNLTSVVIPDGVTSIGNYAFSSCSNLTSVVLGDSVETIGNSAFSFCSNLTSVVIPDSVTSIGSSAFSSCSNLTSVVIPNSVTRIGQDAFWYCSKLTIYCEAESKPAGWSEVWNDRSRPVVWGYTKED